MPIVEASICDDEDADEYAEPPGNLPCALWNFEHRPGKSVLAGQAWHLLIVPWCGFNQAAIF
jgi:hypothetical protein